MEQSPCILKNLSAKNVQKINKAEPIYESILRRVKLK